jgi:hypothetical protein
MLEPTRSLEAAEEALRDPPQARSAPKMSLGRPNPDLGTRRVVADRSENLQTPLRAARALAW